MIVKKILKSFLAVILIFGAYYLIKGGVLVKMPKIEINNNNNNNLNCEQLKKYQDLKEVPENLKENFQKCFLKNDLNEEVFKIIKLENDKKTTSLNLNEEINCVELENLPYTENEILNSSTLREKYKKCLNLEDSTSSPSSSFEQFYPDNYYDLNNFCSLFEPIKDINECNLIIDEFGRNNCRICKERGF